MITVRQSRPAAPLALVCALLVVFAAALPARAADRDRISAFLEVTGFDVALDSIRFSAESAPQMLGLEASDFGAAWERLAAEVFDTALMRGMATDILAATLDDEMLGHAAAFYASDLGQRLVAVENAAHADPDEDAKQADGADRVARMMEQGDPRLGTLKRMNAAIGSAETSLRAMQEIQIRFLLAASAAGVIELRMDAGELRALFKSRAPELLRELDRSALAGAAHVYRDISDEDLAAYAEALEHPLMRRVYELMNAVQYEIMANRFEALAARMSGLAPSEDI